MKTVLSIRVVPNARKTSFEGVMDDGESLRIRLQAPPVDGKANAALCKWLVTCLQVPRSAVTLIGGEKSRRKRVQIDRLGRDEILSRISG